MSSLSVIRFLLALALTFGLSSCATRSFLKGLLIGSLLGKKGMQHQEKEYQHKDYHHYEPPEKEYTPVVHKEYVPVPVPEPHYVPVYIVKDCHKKKYQPVLHQHKHIYEMADKMPDFGSGYKFGSGGEYESEDTKELGSRYRGTLDTGYKDNMDTYETKVYSTPGKSTYSSGDNGESNNSVSIDMSVRTQKDYNK